MSRANPRNVLRRRVTKYFAEPITAWATEENPGKVSGRPGVQVRP